MPSTIFVGYSSACSSSVRHRDDLLVDELADELDELALLLGEAIGLLESGHLVYAAFAVGDRTCREYAEWSPARDRCHRV